VSVFPLKLLPVQYKHVLKGRLVRADVQGNNTCTVAPGRSSPQGGILSSLIWNLVMDSLLRKLKGGPVKVCYYADDLLMMIRGSDERAMADSMQRTLNVVQRWSGPKGVSFNPDKMNVVIFERSRRTTAKEPYLSLQDILSTRYTIYRVQRRNALFGCDSPEAPNVDKTS